ncbi:ParM/StbA family protein [Orenia marismortui]|uniref:ParM/StbA family protein n=1 Tax=Orenia marismortui TaxID=46469 RepID=UPI00037F11AD|nr:ParM/StbA family protein [Orenia marismortui]
MSKHIMVDFGHSGLKAGDGEQEIFIPSVISNDIFMKRDKSFFDNFDELNNLVVEYEGVEYAVGNLAIDKGGNHKISDDASTSKYAERLIVSALAYLCKDNDEINLMLNLPATHFRNKKELVSKFEEDNVKIGLYDYDKKEIVHKNIVVNALDIKPQGYYTTADYISDRAEGADGFLVGVDIGYYSTDLYVSIDGEYQDYVPTKTIPGLHLVHEKLCDIIKVQTGIEKQVYEMEYYIEQGYIKHRGQKINLEEATKKLYKFLADTIADQIKNLLQDKFHEADQFIFGGGGTTVLKDYLKEPFHSFTFLEDPRFVNVRAANKLAEQIFND